MLEASHGDRQRTAKRRAARRDDFIPVLCFHIGTGFLFFTGLSSTVYLPSRAIHPVF